VSVSWRPKDDNSEADWRLAFSCVGEIDRRTETRSYRGRDTDARPAICGWRRRWGRLRAEQASSGSGDGSEKSVLC
jgi:hypothetical protein